MLVNYKKLAHNIFNPQMIVSIDNDERILEVCEKLIMEAGYPLLEDDGESEGWLEFVYEAQDMCSIAKDGFVYKRERNPEKRDGWEMVLYTRENHPAFDY